MAADSRFARRVMTPPAHTLLRHGFLVAILLVPPAAWFAATLAGYGLVQAACVRLDAVETVVLQWPWLRAAMIATVCIGVAAGLVAVAMAARAWRRTGEESPEPTYGIVEVGEGRNRFLACWAIFGGALFFALGVAFALPFAILVPACSG